VVNIHFCLGRLLETEEYVNLVSKPHCHYYGLAVYLMKENCAEIPFGPKTMPTADKPTRPTKTEGISRTKKEDYK